MSRVNFNEITETDDKLSIDKFVLLKGTLAVVSQVTHYPDSGPEYTDVNIHDLTSFRSVTPDVFSVTTTVWYLWKQGKGYHVRIDTLNADRHHELQQQQPLPKPPQKVPHLTPNGFICQASCKKFGSFEVLVCSDADMLKQLRRWHNADPVANAFDPYSIALSNFSRRFFALVASEEEFEEKFGKALKFLRSKNLYQSSVGQGDSLLLFIKDADSLYAFDSDGLLHITPDNTLKNPARILVLGNGSSTDYTVYFK